LAIDSRGAVAGDEEAAEEVVCGSAGEVERTESSMKKLSEREKNMLLELLAIADAQGREDDGSGQGDYQNWTDEDFGRLRRMEEIIGDLPTLRPFTPKWGKKQ
jgi:hypothetical protein